VSELSSEELILVKEVSKSFKQGSKRLHAVAGVSLAISEGQIINVIGESGCGKSTLGKLCAGVIKPDEGSIFYRGHNIWKLSGIEFIKFRRSVQLIHQNPYGSFNPMKKIYSSLEAPIRRYNVVGQSKDKIREKAAELLESVGLQPPSDFLDRYPHQLSGGQLQRIAIARALSVDPEFIVADEPTSMLDASLRVEILDLLLSLRKSRKLTYLHITHDFAIARYFGADQVSIILYLGSIVEKGVTEKIIQEPLHPYTKVLMSSVLVPDPRLVKSLPLPKLRSLELPDPVNPPPGCPFHPRCPYAMEVCKHVRPELIELENGRQVACHLYR
jgi:oligopeptide/dipeptide ABC transporter ATP-binding protein